ncbi:MAG: oligoendopeptidase F family protein, partial [Clostridiales bacterium]|nr:oligoendopeptidase F family protein [Clostridiales bacterium]
MGRQPHRIPSERKVCMEQELTRGTVDPKYTWDVSRIYESDEAWESAFEAAKVQADALAALADTLSRGKEAVIHALNMENALNQSLGCIYTYAMMKQHEDTTVGRYQAMLGRAGTLVSEAMAKAAFLTPELLSLQEGTLEQYIADPDFADFDAALRAALRQKPHTLSAKEEQLMAMASEVCSVSENIYDMLTDADMDLGKTRDEDGKKAKLTDARLHSFLISPDRA